MACASISAITQLAMHHTLHDKLYLHCDLSLEFFKPRRDGGTCLLCWTLGNESDRTCYPMSGRQSTCPLLLTALQQLYIAVRIISINHVDLLLQDGMCLCGNGREIWKMTNKSLEEHISVDKECYTICSVSAATRETQPNMEIWGHL